MLAVVRAKDTYYDKSSYHRQVTLTEKQLRSYDKEFYSLLVKFLVNTQHCRIQEVVPQQ